MNTDPRLSLSTIEAEVQAVWNQHAYIFGQRSCTCGVTLNSTTEADLHFGVMVFEAGYGEGYDEGYRDGRGEL